jgi:hypothetical protein
VALKAELVDYLDVLQFEKEHPLNAQPLRIDAVVIKVPPGVEIKKNFARNFRGHNLFEYKNPEKSLGISDYIKGIGYACLYQFVEGVDYTDITVTFVCTMKPISLLEHLTSDASGRYTVTEKQPGIYAIEGERFPVQILESKLLSEKENAWLSSLKEDANRSALEQVIQSNEDVSKKINLSAFWYVVSHVNAEFIEEVLKVNYTQAHEKLMQVLEDAGYNQSVEDKVVAVIKGLQKNIPSTKLSADTGMPLERVEKIRQEVYG